jgi:arylsulfatase A-like enzyme
LAGQSPDSGGEDSWNILPVLRGAALLKPIHTEVIHHSGDGMFAIRMGDWKLIEGLGSGGFTRPKRQSPEEEGATGQLYNLAADPGETTNLWESEPEMVERLTARLNEVRGETAAP